MAVPVRTTSSALPADDPKAWAQLLASPTPLLFPASSSSNSSSSSNEAELLAVVRSWSWEKIGEGLGPHARAFVGQPGVRAFPYYERNMPLEGVPASRGLSRSAEPVVSTGEELVARVRDAHRSAGTDPSDQSRLVYGSQSLLHLKGGEVDERATARGPMPAIGAELIGALRQIGAGATTTQASAALWLGSGGSVTPLHYDTSHNVYVQVHGAKQFKVLPPSAAAKAHLYPSLHPGYRQSLLDISATALAGLNSRASQSNRGSAAQAKGAKAALELAESALTVTLWPGDVLILPPYWLHSVEALTGTGEGVASVACWFSAKDFFRTEAIYSVRLPFQSSWGTVERATAVFSFLRAIKQGYDKLPLLQPPQQQLDDKQMVNATRGLGLLPALRSRYTQLYTAAFRASVIKRNQPEQLCGTSLKSVAASDGTGTVGRNVDADTRIFEQSGKLEQMLQKVDDIIELLRQQHPPAVAALNFANFGEAV